MFHINFTLLLIQPCLNSKGASPLTSGDSQRQIAGLFFLQRNFLRAHFLLTHILFVVGQGGEKRAR